MSVISKMQSAVRNRQSDKFGYINDDTNMEYYKWQVCREFPALMKKALEADDDVFYKALNEAKKSTFNLIDSYTQPFGGLVEFAKSEPAHERCQVICRLRLQEE